MYYIGYQNILWNSGYRKKLKYLYFSGYPKRGNNILGTVYEPDKVD